jgi:hypothetical protein
VTPLVYWPGSNIGESGVRGKAGKRPSHGLTDWSLSLTVPPPLGFLAPEKSKQAGQSPAFESESPSDSNYQGRSRRAIRANSPVRQSVPISANPINHAHRAGCCYTFEVKRMVAREASWCEEWIESEVAICLTACARAG